MTAEGTVPYPVVLRAPDLDWVKFDAELSRDGSVEPVEKALYAALASYADTAERNTAEDPDDEDVPTRRRLAACIGRSVKTVDRATVRLEEIGLIEVERRRDPDNPRSNLPSTYRLLDRERWDERAGERAAKRRAEREKKRAAKEAKEKAEREAQQAHACGHPGDTDVPTPGDTSVATLGTPVSRYLFSPRGVFFFLRGAQLEGGRRAFGSPQPPFYRPGPRQRDRPNRRHHRGSRGRP